MANGEAERPALPRRRVALWLLVVGVLIAACGLLWVGGELHYRNCLTKAQVQLASESNSSATDYGKVFGGGVDYGELFGGSSSSGNAEPHCSRLPF